MTGYDHPIALGRWVALKEEAFWVPMAGIVARIVGSLGLKPELAGELISTGMECGQIGHKPASGDDWIVAPRGAELMRMAGFNYKTMLDWQAGCLQWPGGSPVAVLIFWPDVERAAEERGTSTEIIEHEQTPMLLAASRGRPPRKRTAIEADMRKAIDDGVITRSQLGGLDQESLAAMFSTSRKTAVPARKNVLQIVPNGPGDLRTTRN